MQIRFTTKRGTDKFHFHVSEQFSNEDLNANTWFNNVRGHPPADEPPLTITAAIWAVRCCRLSLEGQALLLRNFETRRSPAPPSSATPW